MDLIEQLKLDEGFRSKPYRCTGEKLTIGYGRNIEDKGISEQEAEHLLINDIKKAEDELSRFPFYVALNKPRREALTNMMFNLGLPTFSKFKRMIAALERFDYDTAANEMLDSKWAAQVGNRAIRLSYIVRSGGNYEI